MTVEVKSRNDLGKLLQSLNLNGNGIEIGVGQGKFSQFIIDNFKLSKVYLLDNWSTSHFHKNESVYNNVVNMFKKFDGTVEVIRKDSVDGCKDFPDDFFDFIYIDADHSYEAAKEDIENWYPKCKVGGVFSGHDYLDGLVRGYEFGVKRAIDEFAAKNNKDVIKVPSASFRVSESWYFVK